MLVQDLDGLEYDLKIKNNGKYREDKSSYHLKALEMVKNIYPTMTIVEELPVRITKGKTLYFDIVVVEKQLFIEIQGESHFDFSSFHHKDKLGFIKSQVRDESKKEWCKVNSFYFAALPYFEIDSTWQKRMERPLLVDKIKVHCNEYNEAKTLLALSDSFCDKRCTQYVYYQCQICRKKFTRKTCLFSENKTGCKSCSSRIKGRLVRRRGTLAKDGKKVCSSCLKEKSVEDFSVASNKPDKLDCICKECHSDRYLKYKYGITREQYNQAIERQNYCCSICKRKFEDLNYRNPINVDHDHANGNFREILCHVCNTSLGTLEKIINSPNGFIEYLRKHNPELFEKLKNAICYY